MAICVRWKKQIDQRDTHEKDIVFTEPNERHTKMLDIPILFVKNYVVKLSTKHTLHIFAIIA